MSNVTALMRRNQQLDRSGDEYELQMERDEQLKSAIERVKMSGENFVKIDRKIRTAVGGASQENKLLAKILGWLPIPEFILDVLPDRMLIIMAENGDALEFLEGQQRKDLNMMQAGISDIINISLIEEE